MFVIENNDVLDSKVRTLEEAGSVLMYNEGGAQTDIIAYIKCFFFKATSTKMTFYQDITH